MIALMSGTGRARARFALSSVGSHGTFFVPWSVVSEEKPTAQTRVVATQAYALPGPGCCAYIAGGRDVRTSPRDRNAEHKLRPPVPCENDTTDTTQPP